MAEEMSEVEFVEASYASSGHLLDRPIPQDYRREWTERIASVQEAETPGIVAAIVFRLGNEWLALPAPVFQEVVDGYTVRTVPHRRNGVLLGLVNVRGELLLCVALEAILGQTVTGNPTERRHLLVMNKRGERVAFPVDEIFGVLRYHPRELVDVPATVAKGDTSFTAGLLRWNDRAVGCLNEDNLLKALNGSFA
jgi:chemotaxis-related protein WspD